MQTRRTFARSAMLTIAGLGIARPALSAPAATSIKVAIAADIISLDPMADISIPGVNVQANIYDALTVIDATGAVVPRLASRLDVSPDATVWTATVRDGVRFHNGDPLTVDDVIWTFETARSNPKSTQKPYLGRVKAVEKIGQNQVRFTLDAPFVPFDRQLSLISVLPKKAYAALGADFAVRPVGSGAYKLVEWAKDSRIVMAANPDYWDGRPAVDEIVMIPMPSEPARASALASGEIDMVPVLPPTFVPRLSRDPNLKIVPVKSNRATFLGFNHHDPVLGDLKVRQAIDCAIDRDKITKVLLRGFGEPIGQVDPPVLFGYDPTILPTPYDPAKAKRLLAESSYKGETIPFDYPTNRLAFGEEVAQAIGGYLQEIGLKLELRHSEFAAFFPNWLSNKFPGIFFYGLGMSVMDSDLLLGFDYESKISHGYWSSPEVDDLIRRQRGATNPRERAALLSKIWTISRDNVVYAPLYAEIQVYGFRKGVEYTPRADERLRFQDARVTPS